MTPHRRLDDLDVSPIAAGTAGLIFDETMDGAKRIAALTAAVEGGTTVFDTAYAYSPAGGGHAGERIIANALRDIGADDVTIVTKGGHFHAADGTFPIDGRPAAIQEHCRGSLEALRVDAIDLYLLHWPDPKLPFDDSVWALRELVDDGLVRRIGLSNVTIEQLETAREITHISAVQNRYLIGGGEDAMLRTTEARGITYLAYSPLGLVDDWRAFAARPGIATLATTHDATAQQLVIAWLLARSPSIVPVSGATKPSTVRSTIAAADLLLSPEDITVLSAELGAVTTR
ncbi:aldo/keto reductase [Plantibacter sp. Mn2098]|uniref:aldo/keto reductase n=1 Tax=Plantibacter sp. Mn2098 TaxID=3395266 RepID=UPI003BBE431A